MQNPFQKAVKHAAKARVAIMGVSGGGKTFTALKLARQLAGPEGKIAYVDTEHGSAEKYADMFQFDHVCPDSFAPGTLQPLHDAAAANGYSVFVVDSLSHYWMGKDGALEFVDQQKKRHRDQMQGWKDFNPHERAMVDCFIRSPMHVIVTMRVKTDYQEEVDQHGKKKRVKVGLAPVQREGLEYEFDLIGSMDWESNFIVDKTRCSALHGKVFTLPKESDFQPFVDWLAGVERTEGRAEPQQPATEEPLDVPKFRKALAKLCDRYLRAIGPKGVMHFERILRDNGIESVDHGNINLTRAEAFALYVKIEADCAKTEKWAEEQSRTPEAKSAAEFVDDVNPDPILDEHIARGNIDDTPADEEVAA